MAALWFPPFHLDLERAELRHGERRVALRPKALALLEYLASRPGRLLGSRELLEAVWPDVTVSAVALKVCIRELRRALCDPAGRPRFIETVPRRGYRFIAAVETETGGGGSAPGLFGRGEELARVGRLFERARAGQSQLVWVSGEAGIGKTAFVTAFLDGLRAATDDVWTAAGQCAEHYGGGEAFLPVLDALGRLAAGRRRRAVLARLRRHAPTWLLQLPALLGTGEGEALRRRQAGGTRERMLREIVGALEALAATRPLVLALEDLHWSDVSTLDLLAALARRPAAGRLLIVATCRPVAHTAAGYPLGALLTELVQRHQAVALPLAPLGVGAIGDYLLDRFGGAPGRAARDAAAAGGGRRRGAPADDPAAAIAALAAAIHRHSAGNPLFMVAVADHLVARGLIGRVGGAWVPRADAATIAAAIPDSLRTMVGAQIDHLRADDRRRLEAASAAGDEFAADAVAAALGGDVAASEAALAALAASRRLIRPAAAVERPGGEVAAGFAFVHALHRQALYDGVAAPRRARLHQRLGEHLEAWHAADSTAVAAELAVHFERAGDRARAIRYHQQAGEKALARHAYEEAAAELRQALDLLALEPPSDGRAARELALRVLLGVPLLNARGFAAPAVRDTYAGALALCRQLGDVPQLFPVLEGLHTFYAVRGEIDTAYDLARQLERLAARTGDAAQQLEVHHTLGGMELKRGALAAARDHLERAVALYDAAPAADAFRLSGHDPKACALGQLAQALWLLGHPDQALQRARQALAWGERIENAFSRALAGTALSFVHVLRREAGAARTVAEAVLALAEEQGFPHFAALATMLRGWAVVAQGDADLGLEQLRLGLAVCEAIGVGRAEYLVLYADACLRGGRPEPASAALDEAERAIAAGGERYLDAEILRLRAALCGGSGEAAALLRAARQRAAGQSAGGLDLRVACQLAAWQRAHGQPVAARATLASLVVELAEGRDTGDVAEARALFAALAKVRPRRDARPQRASRVRTRP